MYPEDRVLVGVIKARRDLNIAQYESWYRIPQVQMPGGIQVEYLAFFLSGAVFKDHSGAIHYYARMTGVELHYRRDLIPNPTHKRANERYYKVQLDALQKKVPPIHNSTQRRFAFIVTTWDRFVQAREIPDLYSRNDYFVDRIYHALRSRGIDAQRTWEAGDRQPPKLRVLCQRGDVTASPELLDGALHLDMNQSDESSLNLLQAEFGRLGGARMINIPLDGV